MSSSSFELKEMVRAGAGAGKTTKLTERVLKVAKDYHNHHGSWPRIIVTTFTKKATQELRERLITKACTMKTSQNCTLAESKEALELLEYVSSPSQLRISTLDGVFSHFLRSYGHLLGWDSQFTTVSTYESHSLAKKTLRQILFREESKPFYPLVEAYGFQKLTNLLIELFRFRLEFSDLKMFHSSDFRIIVEESLRAYAQDIQQLLSKMTEFNSLKWMEYKAYLNGILQSLKKGIEKKDGVEQKDWIEQEREIGSWNHIAECVDALPRKPFCPKQGNNQIANTRTDSQLKKILEKLKKDIKEPSYDPFHWKIFDQFSCNLNQLSQIFTKEFQLLKKQTGQFDISDLGLLTHQISKQEPQIAEIFSKEWDYWFVDEYQDTSPLQVEILSRLMGDRPYFIVGDPQQSIYLFRGARSEVFDLKEKSTLETGGQLNFLDTNYRSRPELVYFFNDFFPKISSNFNPMKSKKGQKICPQKVVATFAIATPPNKNQENSPKENENKMILNHIYNLLDQGESYDGICLLARTHNHLKELASFLDSKGLPTHIHTSSGFHERREIVDALSLLKFMLNPHDNFNLIHLLRSPWFYVDDSTIINEIARHKYSKSSYWNIFSSNSSSFSSSPESSTLKHHKSVQTLYQLLQRMTVEGISVSFKKTLVERGFFDLSRCHDPSGRRESNLWKLITHLDAEERRPGFHYLKFVNHIWNGDWVEDGNAVACLEPQSINLMTVHASKGLKFKHVILPRTDSKLQLTENASKKPLINVDEQKQKWTLSIPLGDEKKMSHSPVALDLFKKLSQREAQETHRLLYVALTRAEESVFLSWTDSKTKLKGSWAEKIYITRQEGIITEQNYSWEIKRSPDENPKLHKESKSPKEPGSHGRAREPLHNPIPEIKIRKPYTNPLKKKSPNLKISVSDLLCPPQKELLTKQPDSKNQRDQKEKQPPKWKGVDQQFTSMIQSSNDGILLHKAMESLRYGINKDDSPWAKRWFGERAHEFLAAIDFVQNIKTPPMKHLLKIGFVEWGFQMQMQKMPLQKKEDLTERRKRRNNEVTETTAHKVNGPSSHRVMEQAPHGIVEGVIDLWGEIENSHGYKETWIIDYKSGSQKYLEQAFQQLAFYEQALRAYGVQGQIHQAVIYPLARIVKVPEPPCILS